MLQFISIGPFGEGWENVNRIKILHYTMVLPGKDLASSSFRDCEFLIWLQSENQLRHYDSLILEFILDFCSLGLELLCLNRSSKNLIGFLYISLLETPCQSMSQVCVSQSILIACLILLSIMKQHPPCIWQLNAISLPRLSKIQLLSQIQRIN